MLAGMLTTQPASARLPFAYVTWSDDTQYDLHVMDALSGGILFEANSPEYDCVSITNPISPNRHWLLYGQSDNNMWHQQQILVALESGEQQYLQDSLIGFVRWEEERLTYLSRWLIVYEEEHFVRTYDVTTRESEILTRTRKFGEVHFEDSQWVGNELYTILRDAEQSQMLVERGEEIVTSIPLSWWQNGWIELSPDGVYLSFVSRDGESSEYVGYILSLETAERLNHDINSLSPLLIWKPNANVLTYLYPRNILNLYAAHTREITSFHLEDGADDMAWSPDGRYLSYRTYEEGTTFGYVLDIETGESTRVSQLLEEMYWVDEPHLIYSRYTSEYIETDDGRKPAPKDLWVYNVVTGASTQLTDTPDVDERFNCSFG